MKNILKILLIIAVVFLSADGASRTRGYFKKNGTYVAPHYKTKRDYSKFNNYSTKGNYNPYTGKRGTKDPFKIKKRSRKYYR